MKFSRNKPTKEGFYWCLIKVPNREPTLEIGRVRRISNGFLRDVSGAFDFDWGDWLYWGDSIDTPNSIELEK